MTRRPPRPRNLRGFSFIEMVTVVAIISVVVSAAVPVASSLFQRRREIFLRETLLLMRQGIREFGANLRDDDSDGELDEDPKGDRNRDGFPGIRDIDDNGDLLVDVDWKATLPFQDDGKVNPDYDWRLRSDDDEDMSRDEEAYPSDLFDLVNRTTILRGRIPRDATTQQPAWNEKTLRASSATTAANNDLDWVDASLTSDFIAANLGTCQVRVVASLDDSFDVSDGDILLGPNGCSAPSAGTTLQQLVDEDPRNNIDDDGDGRRDEDPSDMADLQSHNSDYATNLTTYSTW